ncbi:hypothetical protein VMCG_04830 [Cytospora schulzeri]|uniref:Mid2 domain-containing protein n=1 Tax=Cytospora schulzeri TaxID=448051 RepID=A0A423WMT7_9PEZI|nr:hypothetical protein VMCG_04830 [Valsa malicola]
MATSMTSPILSTFPLDPLTTTFTPPAACSGIYTSAGVVMIDDDTSCLPDGFTSTSTNYFSPGLMCPSGYATACNDNAGVSSITTVTCCPYRGDITLGCVTPTTLSGVWEALFCTWIAPETGISVQITISNDAGTTSTEKTTMTSPDGINAFGVRMVYENSDLSAVATTTSESTAKTTSTSGTAKSTSGSGSGDSGDDDDNSGLSLGTVVAIAVVIPVVVIGIAAAVFFYIRKQKQMQRLQSREGPGGFGGHPPPGSVVGDQKGYYGGVGPAGSSYYDPKSPGMAPSEVSGVGAYGVRNQYQEAVELGDREQAVELPA